MKKEKLEIKLKVFFTINIVIAALLMNIMVLVTKIGKGVVRLQSRDLGALHATHIFCFKAVQFNN